MDNIVTNRVTGEKLELKHQQFLSNKPVSAMTHTEKKEANKNDSRII